MQCNHPQVQSHSSSMDSKQIESDVFLRHAYSTTFSDLVFNECNFNVTQWVHCVDTPLNKEYYIGRKNTEDVMQ